MDKNLSAAQNSKTINEPCEDAVVVGPGKILSDARIKLSLSQGNIASRLNIKESLVSNIEEDNFDPKLPATFNRGYLRGYAKLVHVEVDEVLSAYDLLDIAEVQRSEMQSFSNLTGKQAEHSRLMWFSYLIAAILFGLMVLWWFQSPAEQVTLAIESTDVKSQVGKKVNIDKNTLENPQVDPINQPAAPNVEVSDVEDTQAEKTKKLAQKSEKNITEDTQAIPEISTAVFSFSGDCWVNIYDATGERIAWGVKKMGYIMTISGKAPLAITLGRPELATIVFNEQPIDLSSFNTGNIAKFTLPLSRR